MNLAVNLKSRADALRMRVACRLTREILEAVAVHAQPGVTTRDLDRMAAGAIEHAGATSSFLGYRQPGTPPFPGVLCTSVNDEVAHAPPSDRLLQEGDLLKLDFGAVVDGWHGDTALSVLVGRNMVSLRIMAATHEAILRGIGQMVPDNRLSDIGHAIESYATEQGYSVVRSLAGHGIGRALHEAPVVPHFGALGRGLRLKAGMVLAIEPMLCEGSAVTKTMPDGWTVATADGSMSAHFEHTVLITDDGPEILTIADLHRESSNKD